MELNRLGDFPFSRKNVEKKIRQKNKHTSSNTTTRTIKGGSNKKLYRYIFGPIHTVKYAIHIRTDDADSAFYLEFETYLHGAA